MKRSIYLEQVRKTYFFKAISFILVFLFMVRVDVLFSQDSEMDSSVNYIVTLGDEASMNWTTKVLRVKGYGFGPSHVKNPGRRKILARRAAQADAYRNLIVMAKGVRVTSTSCVEDMMLESDSIAARSQGMVKGMQLVAVAYCNDGRCEVTMEVNINEEGQFLLSALNNGEVRVTDQYPKFDWESLLEDLENARAELQRIKSKYTALADAFGRQGKELMAVKRRISHLEKQLKVGGTGKPGLNAQLVAAEKEMLKTKNIVDKMIDKLINQESKLRPNDEAFNMTKKFFFDKKRELDKLSSEIAKYNDADMFARLDREKLLGYVRQIEKIQREIGQRVEPIYNTQTGAPTQTGPPNKPDTKVPIVIPSFLETRENYTGLLLDARGLKLEPALAPAILNQKKEKMYGAGVIPFKVNSGGMAIYMRGSIERAKKRKEIGNNPLVVECIKTINESDVMISNEDAKKLVLIIDLLEQKKVAILR